MIDKNELPNRKPTRLNTFDYNSSGAYFLTICTENRKKILSRIVGGDVLDAPNCNVTYSPKRVELSHYGKIADKIINELNDHNDDIKVDRYVIMPNHIHIILFVSASGASRTSPPTKQHSNVSRFVSTFKRFCNKECGEKIWQRTFYDHIIREQRDYEKHIRYIHENPARWYFDELYTE